MWVLCHLIVRHFYWSCSSHWREMRSFDLSMSSFLWHVLEFPLNLSTNIHTLSCGFEVRFMRFTARFLENRVDWNYSSQRVGNDSLELNNVMTSYCNVALWPFISVHKWSLFHQVDQITSRTLGSRDNKGTNSQTRCQETLEVKGLTIFSTTVYGTKLWLSAVMG